VKKLGSVATFFTLFKGFVCSSVLYLPKSYVNGGWGFQIIMLVVIALLTMYCATLLLQVRKETGSSSYTDIGKRLFGRAGMSGVNLALAAS